MYVGRQVGAATILDSSACERYTRNNPCTGASCGQSAPRESAVILLWQYRVIVVALSVFGWNVNLHSIPNWNMHLNV